MNDITIELSIKKWGSLIAGKTLLNKMEELFPLDKEYSASKAFIDLEEADYASNAFCSDLFHYIHNNMKIPLDQIELLNIGEGQGTYPTIAEVLKTAKHIATK